MECMPASRKPPRCWVGGLHLHRRHTWCWAGTQGSQAWASAAMRGPASPSWSLACSVSRRPCLFPVPAAQRAGPAWCRGSVTAGGSGLGRVSHRQRAPRSPRDCSLPGAPSAHIDTHTLFAPDQSSKLHGLSQVDSASAYLAHVMRLCQGTRAEPPKNCTRIPATLVLCAPSRCCCGAA